jgi:hypothetical protein
MTIFAIGTNIKRLSAPLYPAFENILHQMMIAKMNRTIEIMPKISPKLAKAADICDEELTGM